MTILQREPWYRRLARALGLDPDSHQGRDVRAGSSKHGRGHQRPHDYDQKRKIHRRMAKASRRINRVVSP